MEVSKDRLITCLWEKSDILPVEKNEYAGKHISELPAESILKHCEGLIDEGFRSKKSSYLSCTINSGNVLLAFDLAVLPIHPDDGFLFITVTHIQGAENKTNVEHLWMSALDASGEGVWDMNMQTREIIFSDKWHEIFGYDRSEIANKNVWHEKLHPADMAIVAEATDAYMTGRKPNYSVEFRFLCKDGTYKWILSRGVGLSRTEDGQLLRFIGTHTDITDRKIAEQKYLSVSNLLARLINNLNSGILVTDEQHKVIFTNDLFCGIFGITGGPDMARGLTMEECFERSEHFYKYPEQVKNGIKELIQKGVSFTNKKLELIDGRTFKLDFITFSLDEHVKGEIWKFTDNTEQISIDKRFEEQRKFYENVLHNIPADIAVFDENNTYLFVNRNAFKNEALRQWMIGKTDIDYAKFRNRPDSFYEERFALYNKAKESGESAQMIEKLISKQGDEEYHLRILKPVLREDRSLEFLLAYGINVTDLIVAQQLLKTSADTFSSAFDYSGIGMALISTDGMWLDVNAAFCTMTGYGKEELLKLTFQDIAYPDDIEMDTRMLRKMLKKEISTYTIEKRYISKDKKIVLVLLTLSLVWDTDGTPKFFIAQLVDITDKKKLEIEIKKKNKELEASKESLLNKVDQLEELSHIIAHNLRGPAGNIKVLAETLIEQQKTGLSAAEIAAGKGFTIDQGLQFIQESSMSLLNSLATLMEITEIKLNKEIPFDNCDLRLIINEITAQLQSVIYEKEANIMLELGISEIRYPKAYLENILYNLISNSLKYIRADVVPEISVFIGVIDGKMQVRVKDNGLGLNLQKYGNRIFKLNQVFHAGHDSKGIGLYITKTQVESLGGSIEVKSEEHEGAEFIVTL